VKTEKETIEEEQEVLFVYLPTLFVSFTGRFLYIVEINSFNTFQVADTLEPLNEDNPEPMVEESAADAMAALSLSGAMSSGHSKKKKKKKRK